MKRWLKNLAQKSAFQAAMLLFGYFAKYEVRGKVFMPIWCGEGRKFKNKPYPLFGGAAFVTKGSRKVNHVLYDVCDYNNGKRLRRQVISWDREPNGNLQPVNLAAKIIFWFWPQKTKEVLFFANYTGDFQGMTSNADRKSFGLEYPTMKKTGTD